MFSKPINRQWSFSQMENHDLSNLKNDNLILPKNLKANTMEYFKTVTKKFPFSHAKSLAFLFLKKMKLVKTLLF